MKPFIDPEEKLIINIPDEWYFTAAHHDGNTKKQPYSFEPYEKRNAAFQISYKNSKAHKRLKILPQPKGQKNIEFIETELDGIKSWVTKIKEGGVIIISYVYNDSIDIDQKQSDLQKASESVKSLLVFDEKSKKEILPHVRWDKFMLSHLASIDLANRAYENGSNIELVMLLANQIDAVLRQSLILKKQLVNRTDSIDIGLIHQKDEDKPIFERDVYNKALQKDVINQEMHDNLESLYKLRNKVVHRYVISDLRTQDIIQLVWSYSVVLEKLQDFVISLEQRQFDKQIGIYKGNFKPGDKVSEETIKSLISKIRDKHGNRALNKGITLIRNR